jgi:hypothetical protein
MSKVEQQVRRHTLVSEISDERYGETGPDTDGIWAYLKKGYCNGEEHRCSAGGCCHVVHEWSWSDVAKRLRDVRKCNCDDCRDGESN